MEIRICLPSFPPPAIVNQINDTEALTEEEEEDPTEITRGTANVAKLKAA